MFFIYAKFTSLIGMCLFQASTVFKKVATVRTHRTRRWQFKNGSEGVMGDFGMNLEKYKAGFVIYLQLPLGWRQQWSR
ncbi:hypothetical protein CSX00_01835 [Pseudobutyrivibrio ruminis]|jgi:hypothetical protein|uniref:Uncharacterized protein n=2 Tax=Pseudobutyrivibrio TaxID=46205 RepID=A0A2G3EDD1_9FIRM|nr:hypothetical protein CSX00_01835 [Pseudobutyrivibrio ruminis]